MAKGESEGEEGEMLIQFAHRKCFPIISRLAFGQDSMNEGTLRKLRQRFHKNCCIHCVVECLVISRTLHNRTDQNFISSEVLSSPLTYKLSPNLKEGERLIFIIQCASGDSAMSEF